MKEVHYWLCLLNYGSYYFNFICQFTKGFWGEGRNLVRKSWIPPPSGPSDWCACGCANVFLWLGATLCGPQFGASTSTWSTESFLVSLWQVASGKRPIHQSPSVASLSVQVAEGPGCGWEERTECVYWRGGPESRVRMSSPLQVVVFLNFPRWFSKKQRRSQAQQLDRTASASSEATFGVAGCISFW